MTTAGSSPGNPQAPRRRGRLAILLAASAVAVSAGGWLLRLGINVRQERAVLEQFASRDPRVRRSGAWRAAREHDQRATARIAAALDAGPEPDATVRESYIYALGLSGEPRYFPLAARAVRSDPDPYVRHTAWGAAARLDPAQFRALAGATIPHDDPWDEIGLARAWLELGDPRGIETLLHWAEAGTPSQRQAASAALYRGVASLLEMIGRWPSRYDVAEGETWPAELVAEVRRRCTGLDVARIIAEARPHAVRAAPVRQEVDSLHRKRGRVMRYLFPS